MLRSANTAELTRGSQMALVGGIGSGKTTDLLLTQNVLCQHADAANIFVDMADYTDLSEISTGAILAAAGFVLYSQLTRTARDLTKEVTAAHTKLRKLAIAGTAWVEPWDLDDQEPIGLVPVEVPRRLDRERQRGAAHFSSRSS